MRSPKFKIGLAVIEGFTVQIDNVLLPALVLGMAAFAVFRLIGIESAVKTLACFDVLGDILMIMTGEAALNLVRLLQGLMAAFALLLELGMTLYYRSRHQDEVKLPSYGRRDRGEHKQTQAKGITAVSNHHKLQETLAG